MNPPRVVLDQRYPAILREKNLSCPGLRKNQSVSLEENPSHYEQLFRVRRLDSAWDSAWITWITWIAWPHHNGNVLFNGNCGW